MYWTPAKMRLLADVDEYSFTNAVTVHDKWVLFFHKEEFEVAMPSQCQEMIKAVNISLCSLN